MRWRTSAGVRGGVGVVVGAGVGGEMEEEEAGGFEEEELATWA
jgi:hypothetical protein